MMCTLDTVGRFCRLILTSFEIVLAPPIVTLLAPNIQCADPLVRLGIDLVFGYR